MKSMTANELQNLPNRKDFYVLDVRSGDEFSLCRLEGAECIPLETLSRRHPEIPKNKPVLVYCRSGNRSSQAIDYLQSLGFNNLVQLQGGLQDYEKTGGKVLRTRRRLPIIQQVQIAAGTLILTGLFLAWAINPAFLFLPAFVGLGLTFAGFSGYCGMAKVLELMPWNRDTCSP